MENFLHHYMSAVSLLLNDIVNVEFQNHNYFTTKDGKYCLSVFLDSFFSMKKLMTVWFLILCGSFSPPAKEFHVGVSRYWGLSIHPIGHLLNIFIVRIIIFSGNLFSVISMSTFFLCSLFGIPIRQMVEILNLFLPIFIIYLSCFRCVWGVSYFSAHLLS